MPAMPITTSDPARHRGGNLGEIAPKAPEFDAAVAKSVSSPPTDGLATAPNQSWSAPSMAHGHEQHGLVAVGPGLAMPSLPFGVFGIRPVNPLPVRASKIQSPLQRPDTLSRPRLNGWLERAARGRLAIVIADAGFGKSTLLSDWSIHTRRRTAWYRLEHDDRDWLTFIRHLVAGGREVEEGFSPETYELLCQLGPGGPTQAELTASLAGEMAAFGAASAHGFTLILDDFHAIEGSEETDPVISALLEATGTGFSIVLAARTDPALPPARLRGRNAVHRLSDDQLRFDVPETEALFAEAYHLPLEHDVAVDLVARTEGWAALLSLVRTRLEERPDSDARALVAQLSATQGDLYDFLAEEVLIDLPPDLQEFLTRLSVVEDLTAEAAEVVIGQTDALADQLRTAERIGMLQRVQGAERWRFPPLVRDFLAAHLEQTRGRRYVRDLHLALARHFDGENWRVAAGHYALAGLNDDVTRLVARSLEEVLGSGSYRAALDLLADVAADGVVAGILHARSLLQLGASEQALDAARLAVEAAEATRSPDAASALRNAASIAIGVHDYEAAAQYARRAASAASKATDRRLAEAQLDLASIGGNGNLPSLALRLEQLRVSHQRGRQDHYEAISALNLALVYLWLDRPLDAVRLCGRSDELFARSSRGYEQVSVTLARANAECLLGRWPKAQALAASALGVEHPEGHAEAVLEAAWLAAWFGPAGQALDLLRRIRLERLPENWRLHWHVVELWEASERSDIEALLPLLEGAPTSSFEPASAFRWHLARARALERLGEPDAAQGALRQAEAVAAAQASPIERRLAELQSAILRGWTHASSLVAASHPEHDATLGVYGRELASAIGDLSTEAYEVVARAARMNPDRWRTFLRTSLVEGSQLGVRRVASLLDEIGDSEDVGRLRDAARRWKRGGDRWGDALARRLAPRLWVEDLGLASLQIGNRAIDGRSIRRKALALLLYLLSQPGGAATPDQLIEALWTDLDPDAALNSVHQTIYVLRRVIDPAYRAGVSPEYLHFDSDMVWLDAELVDSRSWRCMRILSTRDWSEDRVNSLVAAYRGHFAADFSYEEWAAPFRDRLHALYLGAVEPIVAGNTGLGDLRWRLWVGQQALAADPEADTIEAQVIGLYRLVDANAAAREQYAHYAAAMRHQLGIEPPPLEDL
jgi:DNA-binding SARP family transcriptional activator